MNNKYYWIKLRTDFFNQETIDFLLSQKNGCEYVVLYQMLCLQTANTNGTLANQVGEVIIPYNIEKIVRDCKYFDYDTIVVALELYKQIGLIYIEEDGNLRITDIERMVGSESATREAIKKREQRLKKKIEQGTQKGTKCLIENRDKRLDIRDKDININNSSYYLEKIENEFGLLSPIQIEELCNLKDKYGEELVLEALKECSINNIRTINYLKGILKNWDKQNIKSINDIKNNQIKNDSEQPVELFDYDWVNDEN